MSNINYKTAIIRALTLGVILAASLIAVSAPADSKRQPKFVAVAGDINKAVYSPE